MPPNSSYHIVPLNAKRFEYTCVKQKFDLTMQGHYEQIIMIERIQNPALYLQYIGRKKEMDKHNPKGHQNERSLFHGTAVDTCPKINQYGFDRSFAGKNGNNNDAIIIIIMIMIITLFTVFSYCIWKRCVFYKRFQLFCTK